MRTLTKACFEIEDYKIICVTLLLTYLWCEEKTNLNEFYYELPKELIWPALADRNSLQHAQTEHGSRLESENLSQPEPRNP